MSWSNKTPTMEGASFRPLETWGSEGTLSELFAGALAVYLSRADQAPRYALVLWSHEHARGWLLYVRTDWASPRRAWEYRATPGPASVRWDAEKAVQWAERWTRPPRPRRRGAAPIPY